MLTAGIRADDHAGIAPTGSNLEMAGASMIISIRNKALKRFWENNEASKLPADRIQKIAMILDRLEAAVRPEDMDLPGLRFHRLIGEQKGRFAVSVTANWRITFAWQDQDALDVDFEDYH